MSSDINDRNMVIFMFVLFYIYLATIRAKLDIMKDWKNIRCNPMYLFLSSFIVSNQKSVSNFNKCVDQMASNAISNNLTRANMTQLNIENKINNMSDKAISDNSNIQTRIDTVNTRNIDISDNVTNIISTHRQNNTQNNTTTDAINTFANRVAEIFDNLKSYLPNIRT